MRMLRIAMPIFGVILVIVCGLVSYERRTPVPPALVIYQTDDNGVARPYVMAADGSNQQSLEDYFDIDLPDGRFSNLRWSPDHRWLLTNYVDSTNAGLYRMRLSDGYMQHLTTEQPSYYPAWSPNGRFIIYSFIGAEAGNYLGLSRADGSYHSILTPPEFGAAIGNWSSDGRWIAFLTHAANRLGLYRMRPDGSHIELVINVTEVQSMIPTSSFGAVEWSPNGDWIAYIDNRMIHIVHPDGSHSRILTDYSLSAGSITWSADSQWIVFSASSPQSTASNIYRLNVDNLIIEQLTDADRYAIDPHFMPPIPDRPFAAEWLLGSSFFLIILPIILRRLLRAIILAKTRAFSPSG